MDNLQVRQAEERERQIVHFTNIDNEDFTHSFRGISITVKKGQTYTCRLPEGEHLAKHLARKLLTRDKKAKMADRDPVGSILWTEQEVDEMRNKIISKIGSEETDSVSPEEQRKEDIEGLEKKYPVKEVKEEITKKDIIEDLKKRGVVADINLTKEVLLEKLMTVETQKK